MQQLPWEADLEAIVAQGSTDTRTLFSFGQRGSKYTPPAPPASVVPDSAPVMRPESSYLIIATPRSGSYLLCDALAHTNLAGRPIEYFIQSVCREFFQRWNITSYASYLAGVFHLGTTPNGVFGAKICWTDMDGLTINLNNISQNKQQSTFDLLTSTFPNLKYIWITRQDKVRQAISYWRASWTKEWIRLKGEQKTIDPPNTPDFQIIDSLLYNIMNYEQEIERYFNTNHIQPFIVHYEDFVTHYKVYTLKTLDFLGVAHPDDIILPEPTLEKQADAWSEKMVQQYRQHAEE